MKNYFFKHYHLSEFLYSKSDLFQNAIRRNQLTDKDSMPVRATSSAFRLLLVVLFVCLFANESNAQDPTLNLAFALSPSTTNGGTAIAKKIVKDANGYTYITGSFTGTVDFDPSSSGTVTKTAVGSGDIFLAKYDASGNYVWVFSIGTPQNDVGFSLKLDASGNIYVTGQFGNSPDFDPSSSGSTIINLGGGLHTYLAKYDNSGNFLWAKGFGRAGATDIGYDLALDTSGNILMIGTTSSAAGVDYDPGAGTVNLITKGLADIVLAKYDASGNYIWTKQIGGTAADIAYSLALDGSGNAYITGSFSSLTVDFDPGSGTANLTTTTTTQTDIFLAKYDGSGNYVWAFSMGSSNNDVGNALALDGSGNIYVTGGFSNTVDFDPGAGSLVNNLVADGNNKTNIFLAKYDASGNHLWAKSMGGTDYDSGSAIALDGSGNAYIAGAFYRNTTDQTTDFDPGSGTINLTSAGLYDIFIGKYDASGNYIWAKGFGDTSNDSVSSITLDASGNLIVAGVFNGTIDFDPSSGTTNLTSTGAQDIVIASYASPTVSNTASAPSSAPTLCINATLTNITHSTTGATGIGTATGLPAGVSATWSSNTITISGTPTAAGLYSYSIPLTGGSGSINATGSITVTAANTIGSGSSSPSLCINTALTNITHTTTGATGIGTVTGLPSGVTAVWSSNTITIIGTPTASGTFNYSIPLTGGCGTVNATGTINVTPSNTANVASTAPTVCINTVLTDITHSTTGATGIGTATGLPSGVTAAWSSNTIIISGTPTASGTFNYSIPLTGGCGSVNATGTITVRAANIASVASTAPTVCINTVLTDITHSTTGATGIGTATGLPAGVTAVWSSSTITISGTPTASGTFNYSIPLTGGCETVNATGTITVTSSYTASVASTAATLCINTVLTNITHNTTGATGIGTPTGLPTGVTAVWSSNTITISGTPTASGTFNYSIPLTGGCGTVNATGTITVSPSNTASVASTAPKVYINTALIDITHSTTSATGIGTATGLPAGVTASFVNNTITISGTPTASGTFNYSIPLTGGCGSINAIGTISVVSVVITSSVSTNSICAGTSITFTATPTGASSPYYQWKKNGVIIPSEIASTYTTTTLSNNDAISVDMTTTDASSGSIVSSSLVLNLDAGNSTSYPATGTAWTDLSGNGNNGSFVGNLSYSESAGGAVVFSGGTSNDYVSIANSSSLNLTTAGTLSIWINPSTLTQRALTNLIGKTIDGDLGGQSYYLYWTGGNITGIIQNGGVYKSISTPVPTVLGWYNYVFSWGNCYLKLYKNGEQAATPLANTMNAQSLATTINIGGYVFGGAGGNQNTFNGKIPIVNIYSRNLSDAEVLQNFNAQKLRFLSTPLSSNSITTTVLINTTEVASSMPTVCINTVLTDITHSTTGATGIGTATGLPSGVTAAWSSNTIIISGTPTASGTFNYSIPLTGGCGSVNATGTITVRAANTAGTASSTPTLCINTALTNITHSTTGATGIGTATGLPAGVTAVWATNEVIISGTPSISGTYNYIIPLTGGCATTIASGSIKVLKTNIWTGITDTLWNNPNNWSCGSAPSSTSDVTIASNSPFQPTISTNVLINSLTIQTGMILTVASGYDLTVTDVITNIDSGTMVVQKNANLIQTNDVDNTGEITVKRDSALLLRLDHTLWSSPVTGSQTLQQFSPNTLSNRFYTYTTSSNTYTATPASSTFTAGKGIAIRASNTHSSTIPTSFSGSFVGIPNNGNVSFALATDATNGYNYNLVGNPYPSTISIMKFLAENQNIVGTLYFYSHSLTMNSSGAFPQTLSPYGGSNYSKWNGTGGVSSTTEAPQFGVHPVPTAPSDTTIPVGQGFLVRAKGAGNVIFTNAMRSDGNNSAPFMRKAEIERHRIWLNLKTDTGIDLNQMMVGYIEGATQAVDFNFDGLDFGASGSSLNSKIDGSSYCIQGRSLPFDPNDLVPLTFKASAVGNYAISLTNTDGLFAGSQDIFVRDNLLGIDHNIKDSPYTFASDAGTFDSRFELVYTQALGIPSKDFTSNSVIVYKNTDWFHVSTKGIRMKEIQVHDVSGRLIYKQSDINATTTVLNGLTKTKQVLLLKITSEDNVTVTVKVIN